MTRDHDRFRHEADLVRDLRELGAVDLTPTQRTLGFERRPLRPDDRPRTAPAWGYAPEERP